MLTFLKPVYWQQKSIFLFHFCLHANLHDIEWPFDPNPTPPPIHSLSLFIFSYYSFYCELLDNIIFFPANSAHPNFHHSILSLSSFSSAIWKPQRGLFHRFLKQVANLSCCLCFGCFSAINIFRSKMLQADLLEVHCFWWLAKGAQVPT